MKKINTNGHSFLQLGVALALVLVLLTAAAASHAVKEGGSNATRIADWLPDDEEFLMESETNRRILGDGKPPTVHYDPLKSDKPFCNRNVYGDCIKVQNTAFKKRPCDYKTMCSRSGK